MQFQYSYISVRTGIRAFYTFLFFYELPSKIYIFIDGNVLKIQGWGAGVGAGCFWLLGAGAARKKTGAGAAWKKSQEPEPLKN